MKLLTLSHYLSPSIALLALISHLGRSDNNYESVRSLSSRVYQEGVLIYDHLKWAFYLFKPINITHIQWNIIFLVSHTRPNERTDFQKTIPTPLSLLHSQ